MNFIKSMTASLAVVIALTASASVQAQSDPEQQQDQVMTLMAAYLRLWSAENPSRYAFERYVTEDAVFEYPYADEAFRRIEGRKAIGHALPQISVTASHWMFSDLKLYETLYKHTFFVEYTVKAYVPKTQRTYESSHLARVTVRDGKIDDYYELWGAEAKAVAFGTIAETDCVSSATAAPPHRMVVINDVNQ